MNILLGQIIIIITLVIFLFYLVKLRSDALDRILSIVTIVIGIVIVIHPNLATRIANFIGIGRGTDLLLYLFILASLFYVTSSATRLRQNRNQMTKIVRSIAIKHPVKQIESAISERTEPSPWFLLAIWCKIIPSEKYRDADITWIGNWKSNQRCWGQATYVKLANQLVNNVVLTVVEVVLCIY
jgi:hypothetical protein